MEAGDHTDSPTAASNGTSTQAPPESGWVAHPTPDTVGRPELPVIAAFVGGFVFAKLLGRFGGSDD